MQLKEREQAISEQLEMIDKVVSRYGDLFTFDSKRINAEGEYNWGGGLFYTYKNGVKIYIDIGFEKRMNTISLMAGLRILYDNMWKGLGLFVKKKSVYDAISMKCDEENIGKLLDTFIETMNETDELKPIYMDDMED